MERWYILVSFDSKSVCFSLYCTSWLHLSISLFLRNKRWEDLWCLWWQVSRHSDYQDSRCLYVVLKDGKKEDFSYRKCLENLVRKKYPDTAESFCGKYFKKPQPQPRVKRDLTPNPAGEQTSIPTPAGEQPATSNPAGEQTSVPTPAGEQPATPNPAGEQTATPAGDQTSTPMPMETNE